MKFLRFLWKREEGQTMAEYGIVLAVITVAVITVLGLLSTEIREAIQSIVTALQNAP